jgi:predicted aldo/keto reductase-like oxidoreductase
MFLASKTGERTYDGAMRDLETSLKRLQTDHLDLWQMHAVSLNGRDTVPAFAPNGAIKALEKAKSEKIVRFGGISGHHRSDVLRDWLGRYDFDTLLIALNAADVHHEDSLIKGVLPLAQKQKIGIIAMKIPAYGRILGRISMREAMGYSLSLPGVACGIIACDSIAMLEENVALAKATTRVLTAQEMRALESKTASHAARISFYRRWT